MRVIILLAVAALSAAVPASTFAAARPGETLQLAACARSLDAALTTLARSDVLTRAAIGASSDAARRSTTCLESGAGRLPRGATGSLRTALADARAAADSADASDRAVLRASAGSALRVVAARAAIAATAAGDARSARAWLLLRERRPSTRLGVPDAPAFGAISALADGTIDAQEATSIVRDDLLGTSLVVLRARVGDVQRRVDAGLLDGAAIDAAAAGSGWSLFDPAGTTGAGAAARELRAAARTRDSGSLGAAADRFDRALLRVRAGAQLDDHDAAALAAQVARFTELVPVEYGRGVRDGRVTTPLEIQEARSFLRGALDAWTALEPAVAGRAPDRIDAVRARLAALDELVTRAERTPDDAADADAVETAADATGEALAAAVPAAWLRRDASADLELVRAALERFERSAARDDWRAAEQARVEAYGAFEFGPELRLRAIDPSLALQVEELVWFGDGEHDGLATLVAARAGAAARAETLAALDSRLDRVDERLGASATPGAVRTSSAIIVLREGMEAVLILAALTAGLAGAAGGRWRRPILVGGALALVATAITFVLARALLDSLARFGERLEVVVSLVAIGVLLLILNWFVHKAYWTGWMAGFQKKKVAITGTARERREAAATPVDQGTRRAAALAQAGGLVVLGFTSIYREGFETVLFLQALVLDAGTIPVLEGAAIGLLGVTGLAVLTIGLQRRLPYRRMLILTGVLIAVVLAAMVGGTVQAMQAVGWLGVHPVVGLHVPAWASTWLGVHPTWEAITLQFAAIVFVIGSYVVAEWWQERRRSRRTRPTDPPPTHDRAGDDDPIERIAVSRAVRHEPDPARELVVS